MKINFAVCIISLSSSLIAANEDVITSRQFNLRKLEDANVDSVTDDGAVEETYEAVVDDVDEMEENGTTDDTNVTEEEVEAEDYVVEEAANAFGTAYYDAVASDDTIEDTEEEVEYAEDDLEEAEEDLEQVQEEIEQTEEEIEQAEEEAEQAEEEGEQAMEEEEAEQSYAMKYSGSANTYNILGSITGFSIVALAAVSMKKRIFPEKKSDVFLRMEDDNLSALA